MVFVGNSFLWMTLLQWITFCCKQLPLRGQKVLSLWLRNFDDFDVSLLKIFFYCGSLLCWKHLALNFTWPWHCFSWKLLIVEFVHVRKMFANISYHPANVWWIKPYNSMPSITFSFLHFIRYIIPEFHILLITTVV